MENNAASRAFTVTHDRQVSFEEADGSVAPGNISMSSRAVSRGKTALLELNEAEEILTV